MSESTGLVHDYLLVMRGAERAFAEIAYCWPQAPISTLLYDRQATGGAFDRREVRTSYLQRLGATQQRFRKLLPLFPGAAERLPVQEHDLVISSSSAFAHGVRPRADAIHICYCHSPFRYAWHERQRALEEVPRVARPLMRLGLCRMRGWDRRAAARVTHYIANSQVTQERIQRFWGREATIIHPPVDLDRFDVGQPEEYFLVVSELVRHKRISAALEAARRADRPVRVVGTGPDLARLRATFSESAEFLGRVPDDQLADLYARAKGVIVPNIEEFGIAAVEAQAAGRPVIAMNAGGARETVIDGVTGVLVPPGDGDALAEALRSTDFDRFSSDRIRQNARRFSASTFRERLTAEVARLTAKKLGVPTG
jgi:glycosyltransferase involved in cell wall biosynthesis